MIQKIRSYLLDDEENKSSVGVYVVIVLLAPMLGIFFEYRKTKSPYLATVNGVSISKAVFRLKLFEQLKILEGFQQFLGKEQGEQLYKNVMGGADVQTIVVNQQLIHALFTGYFNHFIGSPAISSGYIFNKIKKNDARDFFINHFGLLPYELVTSDQKNKIAQSIGFFDMNLLDKYCQDSIAADSMKKIISSPLLSIEKVVFSEYSKVPKKIDFITFSIKKNKSLIYAKKLPVENTIKDNEILSVYQEGIHFGLFNNPREVITSVYVYGPKNIAKNKIKSSNTESLFEENFKKIIEKSKIDKTPLKNLFELEFQRNSYYNQVKFSFSNLDTIHSSVSLPLEVKKKYISILQKNQSTEVQEYYFIHDGLVYFFDSISLLPISHKSFDESREEIVSIIKNKRILDEMYKDSTLIRYSLEEDKIPLFDGWSKGSFSLDVAVQEEKQEKDLTSRSIIKKLYSGGIRKKTSFIIETESDITIYFCSNIIYGDLPYVCRGEKISPIEPYISFLENKAKIIINKEFLNNSN